MRLSRRQVSTVIAITMLIALGCALAGCNELSQRHFGGLSKDANSDGPPKPAPTLAIAKPPEAPRADPAVKPASAFSEGPLAQDMLPPVGQNPLRTLYQRGPAVHADGLVHFSHAAPRGRERQEAARGVDARQDAARAVQRLPQVARPRRQGAAKLSMCVAATKTRCRCCWRRAISAQCFSSEPVFYPTIPWPGRRAAIRSRAPVSVL